MRGQAACLFTAVAAATASRCSVRMSLSPIDGAAGRSVPTKRVTRRASASRVAVAEKDREPVVEDSTTMRTVRSLNARSLSHLRCHSITEDAAPEVNPFALVAEDIAGLNDEVCVQLEGKDEQLVASAQHFFGAGNTREGKRVRPVIVCLMGQATALASGLSAEATAASEAKHQQLAAITEMIHTASLVHDDVLDGAATRRGGSAVHKLFSTKAAVLSGDFLLARASVALARLENPQVVQEMAKSLEALVQGEIMQLQSTADERLSLEYYLTKSCALARPQMPPPPPRHAAATPRSCHPMPPPPCPSTPRGRRNGPPHAALALSRVSRSFAHLRCPSAWSADSTRLQDGLADGFLLQVVGAAVWARPRLPYCHRRRKIRLPLWPRVPGHRRLARFHWHERYARQAGFAGYGARPLDGTCAVRHR